MTSEARILVLALRGRDAEVINQVLGHEGRVCQICSGVDELAAELNDGAGVAVVTEESLSSGLQRLSNWLQTQPAWSDFPFILLATKRTGRRTREAQRVLDEMGNVVVLERPIHAETLVSAVTSALRGRMRQYETRRLLDDLTRAEERLTHANANLEAGIIQRTHELSAANNRLTEEVSERERAQAALAQAQKMEAVGHLTGGIAHDFNNLLTAIFGNLELIQQRTQEPRTARLAGFAQEAAERAAKLTHQLLAFSRSQRLNLQPVDLNRLVLGMSDLLARTIGQQIVVEMAPDEASPRALADVNQLELAILNLAINARDAMPDGGRLKISTRTEESPDPTLQPGRYGVVSVTDTGPGIPASLLDKVFDPFFTTKPVGKGTGLGLSQVFGIAQQSGGTAKIMSREGEGATFEIWLPLTTSPLRAEGEGLPVKPGSAHDRRRILVIDDDEGVRRFIVEGLEGFGYEVESSPGGLKGLERLSARPPHLLIVDYAMPGMNGVEVVQAARELRPDLKIVIATGFADMAAVEAVVGSDRVLRKPFRLNELATSVEQALEATSV